MQLGSTLALFTCLIHASLFSPIPYDNNNPFYKLLKGEQAFETDIINNDKSRLAISFGDRDPKVYTHVLVVPRLYRRPIGLTGFVQFWDFIEKGSDRQLVDFFREIYETAEKASNFQSIKSNDKTERDLVKYGYRMVINSYGSQKEPNHANQWVPHLHAHIGGGECLAPVAPEDSVVPSCSETLERKEELYRTIGYAEGFTIKIFRQKADSHPAEFIFELEYEVPMDLDLKSTEHYNSIHDFAQNATADQIRALGKKIIEVAKQEGFIRNGFRIYSNHGHDAHRGKETRFRLHVAYGVTLNSTLGPCLKDNGISKHQHC